MGEAERFASLKDDIRSQTKRALREQTREIEAQLDAARVSGRQEGIQLGRIDALKKFIVKWRMAILARH